MRRVVHQHGGIHREVAFEVLGEPGPMTCIAIHSGPGFTGRTLRRGMIELSRQMPVALPDLPGCGASSRHASVDYSLEAFGADIAALRRDLDGNAFVLLGHGWGALLAAHLAAVRPDVADALVLVNPLRTLRAEGQDGEAQMRQIARVDPTLPARYVSDVLPLLGRAMDGESSCWDALDRHPWWKEMLRTQWHGPVDPRWQADMADAQLGIESYFSQKGAAMQEPDSLAARLDLVELLGAVRAPVGVIATESDANYVAPASLHVQPLQERYPALPVTLIRDAGHFFPAEDPQAFASAFIAMVKQLVAARAYRPHPDSRQS